MTTLPVILRRNSFTYTQVNRVGRICLYERRVLKDSQSFEVFIVKVKPSQIYPSGKIYPEREVFPCDEDFGKTAWAFSTLEMANQKLQHLVENESVEGKVDDRPD